jgi:TPR repeat protein
MCHDRNLTVSRPSAALGLIRLAAAAAMFLAASSAQSTAQTPRPQNCSDISSDRDRSVCYAATLDDEKALRQEFENYYFGDTVPKNRAKAEEYLNEAAKFGFAWGILLLAQEQEKSTRGRALDAYLQLARNNNCVAQLRLAEAYASGVLVKKNLTQAYFWLLLAKVDEWARKADVDFNGSAGGMSYATGYKKQLRWTPSLGPGTVEIKV